MPNANAGNSVTAARRNQNWRRRDNAAGAGEREATGSPGERRFCPEWFVRFTSRNAKPVRQKTEIASPSSGALPVSQCVGVARFWRSSNRTYQARLLWGRGRARFFGLPCLRDTALRCGALACRAWSSQEPGMWGGSAYDEESESHGAVAFEPKVGAGLGPFTVGFPKTRFSRGPQSSTPIHPTSQRLNQNNP
jgi:hypothetical protein